MNDDVRLGMDNMFEDYCDALRLLRKYAKANATLAGRVQAALDETEQLQAIVDRLPKTADGVPVGPGDVIYSLDGRDLRMVRYAESLGHMAYPDVCYSTREAAESAQKQLDTNQPTG